MRREMSWSWHIPALTNDNFFCQRTHMKKRSSNPDISPRDRRRKKITPTEVANIHRKLRNGKMTLSAAIPLLGDCPPQVALRGLSPVADCVAEYVEQGFVCLPQICGKKKPVVRWKEFQERHPTTREYLEWFYPSIWHSDVGIAVVLGPVSNLAVVDIDSKAAFCEFKRRLEAVPKTATVLSGSDDPYRRHLYFRPPIGVTQATIRPSWHEELEFKTKGSLIIARPSLHKSGNHYRWVRGRSLTELGVAELPERLKQAWRPLRKRRETRHRHQTSVAVLSDQNYYKLSLETKSFLTGKYAYQPGWNSRIFSAACDMNGCGFEVEQATELLLAGAQPQTEQDRQAAVRTIQSAFSQDRTPAYGSAGTVKFSL